MSEQDPPDSGGSGGGGRRRRLEGVIPEILKRAIEIGVDKAQDAPESLKHFVGELKLPKEIVTYILQQVDETKNGLFRVVANEIRDFLEHTNISGEMKKMLTTVQFEINTTVRFSPNDTVPPAPDSQVADVEGAPKATKPEVKTQVHVKREEPRPRRRSRE
ncbi:MAG TPA: hypothetical protein VGI39_14080 [Polyangiaceae bacterium]|jgi:hypothetical protein